MRWEYQLEDEPNMAYRKSWKIESGSNSRKRLEKKSSEQSGLESGVGKGKSMGMRLKVDVPTVQDGSPAVKLTE